MRKVAVGLGGVLVFCSSVVSFNTYPCFAAGSGGDQTAGRQSSTISEAVTNRDVLAMVKAGLSSEVIVAKIKSSTCEFDTSSTELADLKKAGVPDAVILVMVQASPARRAKQPEHSQEPTVDQIIENYVTALGGKAAIEKTTSLVLKGSWASEIKSGTVEIYTKVPNKGLRVMQVPGFGQIRDGFDGSVGWNEEPQAGVKVISGQELSVIRRTSEFHQELKLRKLYPMVILKGEQNLGARVAYFVEADPGDGTLRQMYFDTKTGLLLRDDLEYDTPEGRMRLSGRFEDYRDIDGVKVPFTQQYFDNGGTLTFKFTEARFNAPLDDAVFARPSAGTTMSPEVARQLPAGTATGHFADAQSPTAPAARGLGASLAQDQTRVVSAQTQDWRKELKSDTTLGTVRRLFMNQKVIVGGAVVNLHGSVLLEWTTAHKDTADRYQVSISDHLPSTYKRKSATVVAVQLNELKRRELKPNAFGEIVAEDDVVNPYFDIVVQFDDGTLAMFTSYPISTSTGNDIELASTASALANQMAAELPRLVGKTVYAVGYSKLYQPDTSLEELAGVGSKGVLKQLWSSDVPLLQPLTVLAAKYIDLTGVVFKLKLPNGKEALSFTDQIFYLDTGETDKRPLIERVTGTLLPEIPKRLTQKELDAIRHGSIFKGMSKDAVDYLLGFPDKENDWGRGGKQRIYFDRLFVYFDHDEKVEDWQSIDKK